MRTSVKASFAAAFILALAITAALIGVGSGFGLAGQPPAADPDRRAVAHRSPGGADAHRDARHLGR